MPLSKLYVTPLDGVLTVIVPVVTLHVGCVTVVVGALGTAKIASITEGVAVEIQALTSSFTMTWYVVAAAKPLLILLAWKVVPLSKLYVTPLDGVLTVIVPVVTLHVGCVTVVVGALGTAKIASITEGVAVETQALTSSFTRTWYVVAAANPLLILLAWKVVPLSKLYVTPLVGVLTVIVPVVTLHVGCVTVVVGALGTAKIALITEGVAVDTQALTSSFTMTWYVVAAANPLLILLAWKVVPLSKLYVTLLDGAVTSIEPVVTLQVG